MQASILAVAFSPDSTLVAGASEDGVLIWDPEGDSIPKARWAVRKEMAEYRKSPPPRENGDGVESRLAEQITLAWNSASDRFVFGISNQVSLFPFV